MDLKLKFENEVTITVRKGDTGEVLFENTQENAISDDFLCPTGTIYIQPLPNGAPYCFILPDGPNWSGGTYDHSNPSAPYCISANASVDTAADPQWQRWASSGGYTPPSGILGKTKLFYQWSNLPQDFQLKAIGLTGMQSQVGSGDEPDNVFGAGISPNQTTLPTVFVPQTLVVLPASIMIHGRNFGTETPDVLQISYFLSIVGTS
jgi:hypothetical protein